MKKQRGFMTRAARTTLVFMLSISLLMTMGFGQVFAAEETGATGETELATVQAESFDDTNVSGIESAYPYTGSAVTPKPVVTVNETELKPETDYDVAYDASPVNAGTYTVTITGKGEYEGSTATKTYSITAVSLEGAAVSGVTDRDYTGKAITQSPTVTLSGFGTLKNGTDYSISYKNNTSAGTATMTINGKGNFTGTKNVTFKIFAKADNKGWQKRNGVWYYYKSNGQKLTNGWAKDSHGWCWMDSNGRITKNKWIKYKGQWYFLKSNGYMAANAWAKDSKGWCWMNGDGLITRSKWIKSGGAWYYLKSNGYMAANAWAKDSAGWCWLGGNGKIVSNKWVKWNGDWYFLKPNGYMAANYWQKDSKGWCYLKGSGKMAYNEGIKSKNVWYFMDSYGHMSYAPFVLVSKDDQMLYYYDNARLVMKTSVVTGKWYPKNHDTPTGTYHLRAKQTDQILRGLEDDGKTKYESHVNYWMPFIGNSYGLHDATWRGSFGGTIYKYSGSHGCVNMPYSKAKELYSKIKVNTIIRIQ